MTMKNRLTKKMTVKQARQDIAEKERRHRACTPFVRIRPVKCIGCMHLSTDCLPFDDEYFVLDQCDIHGPITDEMAAKMLCTEYLSERWVWLQEVGTKYDY